MHNARAMLGITLLLFLGLQPGAVGDPPGESLTECPTQIIGNVLDAIGTVSSPQETSEGGNPPQDDPVYPTYAVCNESVKGGCTASESVDITASGTAGINWRFQVYVQTNTNIDVTTYIHCEGIVEADIVNFGGHDIRTVETLIGSAIHEELRGRSHCQYVAQLESCRTHHEGCWIADRIIEGRITSTGGSVSVCGDLSIHNGAGAVVNTPATRELDLLITDNLHWPDAVCDFVSFTVRDDGTLFL